MNFSRLFFCVYSFSFLQTLDSKDGLCKIVLKYNIFYNFAPYIELIDYEQNKICFDYIVDYAVFGCVGTVAEGKT